MPEYDPTDYTSAAITADFVWADPKITKYLNFLLCVESPVAGCLYISIKSKACFLTLVVVLS